MRRRTMRGPAGAGSPFAPSRAAPAAVLAVSALLAATAHATVLRYDGPCDASAAVALDARHFIVANDEDNRLHTFRIGRQDATRELDLAKFLALSKRAEADVEGAAWLGERIYWITSHSRNSKGAYASARHRLFAIEHRDHMPAPGPVGMPYRDLVKDLVEAPALARYRLAEASGRAAEAAGGLNIEGLAATDDGRLLIGFRNPLFEGRALIVPLDNPAEVIAGEGRRARLGAPIELDLGGRGIRSLERVGAAYYVVGGPIADEGTFALFRWSGRAGDAPVRIDVDLGTLRPEALFAVPGAQEIVLLSDDGGMRVDGVECKRLKDAAQAFRALTLPASP